MAQTVCTTQDFEIDENGRLAVNICGDPADEAFPGGNCSPNLLRRDPTCGLHVRERRKTLRRRFSADGSSAINLGAAGPGVRRDPAAYTTVDDNDEGTPGLWTIRGDGLIQINCAGVYSVSQQTIVEGSTGQVVGGRARVSDNTDNNPVTRILASQELNFRNTVPGLNLTVGTDGPEFNAAAVRFLQVGALLEPISNVYLRLVGQDVDWSGEFVITYLGEFI